MWTSGKYDISEANNIKNLGRLTLIIGLIFLLFSIIAYSFYDNALDTLQFVIVLFSSLLIGIIGLIVWKKAQFISHKVYKNDKYRYLLYFIIILCMIIIIMMLEAIVRCGGCVGITLLTIIILICIILSYSFCYFLIKYNKKNTNIIIEKNLKEEEESDKDLDDIIILNNNTLDLLKKTDN